MRSFRVEVVTIAGFRSTPGSSTGASLGVGVWVGLGVRDGKGVGVADGDGVWVEDVNEGSVQFGVSKDGLVVWVTVLLGVTKGVLFPVPAPWQAAPARQMINR